MTQREEQIYLDGRRQVWADLLNQALHNLGYLDPATFNAHKWAAEREETVSHLRSLCRDFGDLEWSDDLHLSDVIDKHLGRHLYENYGDDEEDGDVEFSQPEP
jgi:hypothetical protein